MLNRFNILVKNEDDLLHEAKLINNSSTLSSKIFKEKLLYGEEESVDNIIKYLER